MAIDGSFNLEAALCRFLDRCPKLAARPQLKSLAAKGDAVREEEVVRAVAEVFLHPAYTIPSIGCFRAIVKKIVDRAVGMLRLVGEFRFSPDQRDDESALDKALFEGLNVIDYYVQIGQGLELHECACLAFSRAVDLDPSLLGSVVNYFDFAPPPHQRVLLKELVQEMPDKVLSQYLIAVRTSYRLLIVEPEVFTKLWDWSCFFDFVRKWTERCPGGNAVSNEITSDVRWCSIQIISIILKIGDRAMKSFGVGAEEAFSCLLRWEEFSLDVAAEKAGFFVALPSHSRLGSEDGYMHFHHSNCLQSFGIELLPSSMLHDLESPTKKQKLELRKRRPKSDPFVMTSGMKKSFEMILLAVSQKRPVLLHGPGGCGKSALIKRLAQDSGNHVLSIQMDDQIDGKTLVGAYVCTERPGEFRWQPGSLTQAVLSGFWVVLEDIDKAPADVPLILLPLLEGASSFRTTHGEMIRVAESFRLFSTITTSDRITSRIREGGALWRKIMIGMPTNQDLQNIVTAWYPRLEPVAMNFIETYEKINSVPVSPFALCQSGSSGSLSSLNRFSLRDLLKWCKRVNDFSSFNQICIYQEAVDIFASFSSSAEIRLTTMKLIASILNIPMTEALSSQYYKPPIQDLSGGLRIGRVTLQHNMRSDRSRFVEIRCSLCVLERIARCVDYNEPVLLVGETGTGKTTLVQNLASWVGRKLTVLNLSQQSDVADLLGGFKPIDTQWMCISLYNEFKDLATRTRGWKGDRVLEWLYKPLKKRKWRTFLTGLKTIVGNFVGGIGERNAASSGKRSKPILEENLKAWEKFFLKLENVSQQVFSSGMIFSFVEGAFLTAMKSGEWILLDEINLAPPEILGRLNGVLEGERGSLCLAERGDANAILQHPDFRIFACMNPATDAGKRDLPYSVRSRFTEFFVDDVLDDDDLEIFVKKFLNDHQSDNGLVKRIVSFYKEAKRESEERLQDGANQKPEYSLRSLYRALEYVRKAERLFGHKKAMYDGFCMFFLSLLDGSSIRIMNHLIVKHLFGKDDSPPKPLPFSSYLEEGKFRSDSFTMSYVLTKTVEEHLANLARAIFIKRYPVLLQGPTSSGKTSLVRYLAALTGHKFLRINNHEHTDLQEYLGSYITDSSGRLVFHEGVLVHAVRNGHWIVLDELNLAPSDVLEALNRLLDDNRELHVPELGETISAHPDFMLFATQNPPTFYAGRKLLSRAFRNRFMEIHVGEIPEDELSTILMHRCQIPESYALKMVEVMKDLQLLRQNSKVFAGKHGFVTPRDLFRWADRFRASGRSYEDLARDGYYLLAERLRDEAEKFVVQEVLEKHLRIRLVKDDLYKLELLGPKAVSHSQDYPKHSKTSCDCPKDVAVGIKNTKVIWNESMWRLFFLVKRCYQMREPVLLVGETGGGKTTVCQLLSEDLGLRLHILNCHQYTETSDFIGGFYPIRDRSKHASDYESLIEELKLSKAWISFGNHLAISADISKAETTVMDLNEISDKYKRGLISHADVSQKDVDAFEEIKRGLAQLHQKWQAIFTWQDGPLVEAMRNGDLFLADEISLADDSVLERLNSVLEPERKLSLAEKGGASLEEVVAHKDFFVLATMNPGGDYGKKELSPALRNRFTEIWVPHITDTAELSTIVCHGLRDPEVSHILDPMVNFWEWFNQLQVGRTLTVRDLLSWVTFIQVTVENLGPEQAFLHGAFLVLLDGLSLGTGLSRMETQKLRENCFTYLVEQLKLIKNDMSYSELSTMERYGWGPVEAAALRKTDVLSDKAFGIDPFYIERGSEKVEVGGFEFLAPTTCRNLSRVLRAMQLQKPVLLEGSPGVGKTSLVIALGKYSGHKVTRINLSEQTDMMDLLGSDLPVESDEGMKFAWSDGILLQALKQGQWVLLDELNLAPQSVLEGLNAILDHRAEVFIPELGVVFECPPSFRIFACQNPPSQGGGRKGLPKSFLNRFTKVYVDELVEDDYLHICSSLYPSIPQLVLSSLISFNKRLFEDTMVHHKFGQDGSPWEFNLRDVLRSCEIIQANNLKIDSFLSTLYLQRMRTATDRREVLRLYEQVFGHKPPIVLHPRVHLTPYNLSVGNATIERNSIQPRTSASQLNIMPEVRQSLEAAAHCIQNQWLCILVGPSSSGKTSLIRTLAELTGNALHELNLSSATDISELLGCFEQCNAFSNFSSVVAQVERFVNEYSSSLLKSSLKALLSERKDTVSRWLAFLSRVDSSYMSGSCSPLSEHSEILNDSLSELTDIIQLLRQDVEGNFLSVSWSSKELDAIMKTLQKLRAHLKRPSVKFEWVTGILIKAIENGEWVALDNANLCNPTILDRINSLVEPGGTITVNECGIVDGKPVIIKPHPNFRMFLTVNPIFGEVSRAMRNRGVEICLVDPYWLLDSERGCSGEECQLRDVKRFIASAGVPGAKLVDSMAQAHVYAKIKALCLNVRITYLELSQWIQLFQQLLMNGSEPLWSLQISWEHIHLSSIGDTDGREIINYALHTYLSTIDLSDFDSLLGRALALPGGWPTPLKLRDFMCYSREASVRQNCMYLEFLGAQYASYACETSHSKTFVNHGLAAQGYGSYIYMIDSNELQRFMFPKSPTKTILGSHDNIDSLNLMGKMLLYAANWAVEQATQNDFQLYLVFFSRLGLRFHPHCLFFSDFLHTLKDELNHPIWNRAVMCQRELISLLQLDTDSNPIPILSSELVEATKTNEKAITSSKCLNDAINCVGILRLSYQQWHLESSHNYNDETRYFIPFLESVRALEEKVLNVLVGSLSFELLIQLYTKLIDEHLLFWSGVTSSEFEQLLISYHSLVKAAKKFQKFFPQEVEVVLEASRNLDRVSSWYSLSERSLLWVHGGHTCMPSTAKLYRQQKQLLKLCDFVWPRNYELLQQVDDQLIKIAAVSNSELRTLALRGICMSSYIMEKYDEDDMVVEQLEEIYQMLLRRLECEKQNLKEWLASYENAACVTNSGACCVFSPRMLCLESGFSSWLQTLNFVDTACCQSDMELFQLLQEQLLILFIEPGQLPQALGCIRGKLESVLNLSLSGMRPPQTLVAHQNLLWTIDAWTSVDAASTKVTGFVLEMWYWWHSFLWRYYGGLVEGFSSIGGCNFPLPYMLIEPAKTAAVDQILNKWSSCAIKDNSVQMLKLKAASRNLLSCSSPLSDMRAFLMLTARSLFKQIICAHKKSFDADKFAAIRSLLFSYCERIKMQDTLQLLSSLIGSSSHQRLRSLLHSFIEPLLKNIFNDCSATEDYINLGLTWLHLGGLRFHLLISPGGVDPSVKHSCKLAQFQDKISSLELEKKVREQCKYLAGWLPFCSTDEKIVRTLEKLENERRRLQKKIVFRPDAKKFGVLRKECEEFLGFVDSAMRLVQNLEVPGLRQVVMQVCNWQETAVCFIDRLSNEYEEYTDVTQPFQIAVYEMKLGLSLTMAGALMKEFLSKIGMARIDLVMESIYSFMRFPRRCLPESNINFRCWPFLQSSHDTDSPAEFLELELGLLDKLITVSSQEDAKSVSLLQLKASLYKNLLVRIAHYVANAKLMDKSSYVVLEKIYLEFAGIWMEMKLQVKGEEDIKSKQYLFRPRAFKIESVIEDGISDFGKHLTSDNYMEWQDFLAEGESDDMMEANLKNENLEDEWNMMHEPLGDIIVIHSQLFGSSDLIENPGNFLISDRDRLESFTVSYALGLRMIKAVGGLFASTLDAKLVPEHLLRLCLEHEKYVAAPLKAPSRFNFYKDSNGPLLNKMVKPLVALKGQVSVFLTEWEDHPGLHKLLDVIQALLDIPSSTPLAKALSGLQFLLYRIQMLQGSGCKFSFSDQLEPIATLIGSWQKLEFECWPALLDEVQDQFEENAGKLWFPLFSVLFCGNTLDVAEHEQSMVQSLVEFIQTSSVGEFRRRLKLLYALLRQLSVGMSTGILLSNSQQKVLASCYNIFGFYVQFLPVVTNQLEAQRRDVENELKEYLKLCRWERVENYMSIDNVKRTRQKVKKLIQKYTDVLQQPVMLVFGQLAPQKGVETLHLQSSKALSHMSGRSVGMLFSALDAVQMNEDDRRLWYGRWWEKLNGAVNVLNHVLLPGGSSMKDISNTFMQFMARQSGCPEYQNEWNTVQQTLSRICRTTLDCDEIWKEEGRNARKKRALSELLKLLENSGLQKHKFENMEVLNLSGQCFLQPAYNPLHLLLTQAQFSETCGLQEEKDSFDGWKPVNEFYFKSLASVQFLLQTRWKLHEDFTSEQANRSVSFVNHLILLQQSQRTGAYRFSEQLKRLREHVWVLDQLVSISSSSVSNSGTMCCFAQNQRSTMAFMWQQKKILDTLNSMLLEESLLLKTVKATHLDSCQDVKAATGGFLAFIEKFIPVVQNSKESLDKCLLKSNGALTTLSGSCRPYFVSNQMVELLLESRQVVREFREQLNVFREQNEKRSSVVDVLLTHFDDLLNRDDYMAGQQINNLEMRDKSTNTCQDTILMGSLVDDFERIFKRAFGHIIEVFRKVCSSKNKGTDEVSVANITGWEPLFLSAEADLNMNELCDQLLETLCSAEKLVNQYGDTLSNRLCMRDVLKQLHEFSALVLSFADNYLQRFLGMSKTVSLMTHVLASVLASLYSQGIGISTKDQEDEPKADKYQDGGGIGMGEGTGLKDVSDQITDEDQLLGTSREPREDADSDLPNDAQRKNDKGIEMENDFASSAYSVSEESGEDDDDDNDEDQQLDSGMGETGSDAQIADEKLWNKDEDEMNENSKEKYETGSAVSDKDASSREVRAREDTTNTADDYEEPNPEKLQGWNDENKDDVSDTENTEDMNLNKEEAFADPSGLKADELPEEDSEDVSMDEAENLGEKEETDNREDIDDKEDIDGKKDMDVKEDIDGKKDMDSIETRQDEQKESADSGELQNPADETTDMEMDDACGSPTRDDENPELKSKEEEKGMSEGMSDLGCNNHVPNTESGLQPVRGYQDLGLGNSAPASDCSNSAVVSNPTPSMELPSGDGSETMVSNPSAGERLTDHQMSSGLYKSSAVQNIKSNPYRNIGDALEDWKERAKVSVDLHGDKVEPDSEVGDKDADEYGYVSEFETGTTQALGPATTEQMDTKLNVKELNKDLNALNKDEVSQMDIADFDLEKQTIGQRTPTLKNNASQKTQVSELKMSPPERSPEVDGLGDGNQNLPNTLVSVNKSYFTGDACDLSELSLNNDDLGRSQDLDEAPHGRSKALVLWRRYDLLTTKLSHELAEQLRLIMEPTLATKLQGDYRTGKRINMKKVIPYIASHFRKDKIWLRRTKPNKCEYQVVIAVDDSRSMSESHCGDFAVRALVTVCRAMSQLEVGNLAVASFGKKGNIKLLHDFDESFTLESGIKMISSLTFKQENTIEDEPVVDLLTFLNNKLDAAVAKARAPSGKSPLEQLVLIIGDGRFHEKESLKRCVRDFLAKKRMVAFMLLDNQEESIVDLKELTMQGGAVKFSKYLDSFPFPYYMVLRDIEALPRTLADLLRQWFELVQSTRD